MKLHLCIILGLFLGLQGQCQESFTARKGSSFFPGHKHVVISIDSSNVHYQLFNHWYSLSYAQYRDILFPKDELINDSITIRILNNKIKLIDKRYGLSRKIRHQRLCAPVENMRKISYANTIAERNKNMTHFQLYDHDDLKLSEEEFKQLVNKNLEQKIKSGN